MTNARRFFGLALVALAAGQFAIAQPPPAGIDQLAPPPTTENRAATPADRAIIGNRPPPKAIGKADQISAGAAARAISGDGLVAGSVETNPSACSTGARIDDVLAHLPAGAARAIDGCATLSWLEDERRSREADAVLNDVATVLDGEKPTNERPSEARRKAE